MFPFEYYIPTKIVFGEGNINKLGKLCAPFGKKAILVTYEEELVKKLGFFDKALGYLNSEGIEITPFFGVKSNPTVEHIRRGVSISKVKKPDFIIALGGGSVIDTVKAMSISAFYEGDVWDLAVGNGKVVKALPIVTVLTIPATSSEMNATSVISNDKLKRKEGFVNPLMFPKLSILDPELTYSIPRLQTAISATDIVSHLMEGYINHNDPWAPMQDRFAQGMIKTIIECLDKLIIDPKDPQARATMMWTSTFAWNGFSVCGLGAFDMPIHMVGHTFSAFYDVAHGSAMSVSIPAVMKFHLKDRIEKYSVFAKEIFGINGGISEKTARSGINALEEWFRRIGVPTNFKEAGIPTDALAKMADDILITADHWGIETYNKEMVLEILNLCI
jgi:alcohol dehydrogenase YqhD (iron-dependent ADH family)